METTESSVLNNISVDVLMAYRYIRTKKVEKVFRAVDRADYVLPFDRDIAYEDIDWKNGNIHLSAPCIYSEVMEALFLEPGLSFLNLGSGTGYLNTMAGLILNQHGTNHGIELHEDCLKYAYKRLEEFKQKSLALDEFDFCEPLFIQGNCLNVALGRRYDRVYCGAECPESHEAFIRQFIHVGGILVMPFMGYLLRIYRLSEDTWLYFPLLFVSFSPLIMPTVSEQILFHLPECDPLSLQELCRSKIRHRLRENVWNEHADLETKRSIVLQPRELSAPHLTSQLFGFPVFEEYDRGREFSRPICLLLNVDTHSSERYTISEVRTVVQTNPNENQNWRKTSNNGSSEASNSAEGVSSSSEERSQENKVHRRCLGFVNQNITPVLYFNFRGSDTDNDADQGDTLVQRKKVAKQEQTDSGIVEDVNLSNEDGSSCSDTSHSDLETVDPSEAADAMDSEDSEDSEKELIVVHRVNNNAFSTYLREKIHQLPLPFALKLYIAYNREL